jgi:hypothetical protein
MTVTRVADEDKKDLQQKRVVVTLFSICILGFSYLVYDYFNIVNHTVLPEDLSQIEQSAKELGNYNPLQARLVVDEDKWAKMSKEEKIGIVTQLARDCASRRKEPSWAVEVVGNRTSSVVAQLGSRGLLIQ